MAQPARAQATTVRLSFQPLPVHVRTARLVAVTVARRAGWPEEQVESVRQAVGEACTLALQAGDHHTVTLELDDAVTAPDGAGGLRAWVWPVRRSSGPSAGVDEVDEVDAADGADAVDEADDALPRAVLAGLTDDVAVDDRQGHPALRLSWWR